MRIIYELGFGVGYIRGFTVGLFIKEAIITHSAAIAMVEHRPYYEVTKDAHR